MKFQSMGLNVIHRTGIGQISRDEKGGRIHLYGTGHRFEEEKNQTSIDRYAFIANYGFNEYNNVLLYILLYNID